MCFDGGSKASSCCILRDRWKSLRGWRPLKTIHLKKHYLQLRRPRDAGKALGVRPGNHRFYRKKTTLQETCSITKHECPGQFVHVKAEVFPPRPKETILIKKKVMWKRLNFATEGELNNPRSQFQQTVIRNFQCRLSYGKMRRRVAETKDTTTFSRQTVNRTGHYHDWDESLRAHLLNPCCLWPRERNKQFLSKIPRKEFKNLLYHFPSKPITSCFEVNQTTTPIREHVTTARPLERATNDSFTVNTSRQLLCKGTVCDTARPTTRHFSDQVAKRPSNIAF